MYPMPENAIRRFSAAPGLKFNSGVAMFNIKGLRRPVAAALPRLPGDTPVSSEAGRTE
jgi:hypothetical protein